jgi:hypothetical protein
MNVINIPNVRIQGIHLGLLGYDQGPTLEVFQYQPQGEAVETSDISRQGFGHIAFVVDGVESALDALIEHGGDRYGSV